MNRKGCSHWATVVRTRRRYLHSYWMKENVIYFLFRFRKHFRTVWIVLWEEYCYKWRKTTQNKKQCLTVYCDNWIWARKRKSPCLETLQLSNLLKWGIYLWFVNDIRPRLPINRKKYTVPRVQRVKKKQKKWVHITINDFDAKKCVRYSRMLLVTELVVNGAQCTRKRRESNI